jgi:hypothetical protein
VEREVRFRPSETISFDAHGFATVRTSVGSLAERAEKAARAERSPQSPARAPRLFVLGGSHPITDVGALHATAPPGTLFQVASQFNGLESPGPYVADVADYPSDPTQGPRAATCAFAGALVRHYAAPAEGGARFVQRSGGPQLDFVAAGVPVELGRVQSGYLQAHTIADGAALARALGERRDALCVGVHEGLEVVLGARFFGGVAPGTRVSQVLTSTLAAGGYGHVDLRAGPFRDVARELLLAAYRGTLFAARALGCRTAVLTLIGGGVFGNPVPLIWEALVAAFDELAARAPGPLDVVVNGRNLPDEVVPHELDAAARARGGGYIGTS